MDIHNDETNETFYLQQDGIILHIISVFNSDGYFQTHDTSDQHVAFHKYHQGVFYGFLYRLKPTNLYVYTISTSSRITISSIFYSVSQTHHVRLHPIKVITFIAIGIFYMLPFSDSI